jgi:hypothetical protein
MYKAPRLIKFFEENAEKSKDEVVELLMKGFNFKKSTAMQRYVDYNSNKKGINYKKLAFDFFDKNPLAIEELECKRYAEKLCMTTSTYTCYKTQYKKIKAMECQELPKEPPKYGEKYYKGRLREKFTFNDSKLFK